MLHSRWPNSSNSFFTRRRAEYLCGAELWPFVAVKGDRKMFNKCFLALAAFAAGSALAATAHADSLALTVVDTGSAAPAVTYSGSAGSGYCPVSSDGTKSLGNFWYNISDGATLGASAGPGSTAALHYDALTISNTGSITDTLEMILSATGFGLTSSGSYNAVQFNHSDGGTFEGGSFSMTFQTFADSADTLFESAPVAGATTVGTSVSTGTYSNNSPTSQDYTLSAASSGTLRLSGSPYSLTSVLQVTLAPNQSISLTNNGQSFISAADVSAGSTPEPAVLPIFAAGLMAIGLVRRKGFLSCNRENQ